MSYLTTKGWPWKRTGPGLANDGKPKFDMTQFEQKYFDILKERVQQIENRGMYASVMIFGSHIGFKEKPEKLLIKRGSNVQKMQRIEDMWYLLYETN